MPTTPNSPLQLLFYFVPKSLWVRITKETNRYKKQTAHTRAKRIRAKQLKRGVPSPERMKQIERRLLAEPKYAVHEILHVMGLLVSRMLNPMTRRFSRHWAMTEEGAIPAVNFGKFMARNRCTSILRDLHFFDNEAPRVRDKLWKLRPVVDTLQSRFLSGWTLPSKFSFDEGVLPATSRRNTTRMLMPDKPRRYGTKLFMVCDSETAYWHRFEVYIGKREAADTNKQAMDSKTGAAAVVRNMKVILRDRPKGFRLVVIDRFYSSVALALQLLAMQSTFWINRIGYDKNIVERRKTRPRSIQRGSFAFSRATAVPLMVACHWWDRKPVHYLATGPVMSEESINRNIKGAGPSTVKCPKVVSDYQRWMGGVDVHDQLRLQSYSIQTTFRFQKYYNSLFMGFLDMALKSDLYRLNVAGLRARLKIKDGSAKDRRGHVDHYIETLEDQALAERLACCG
ncbi:hypothetical protein PHMEG_00030875 [Phytophthora megakarya]|uniref:PiggyBac transposable element-derived protein domain-containing protein n=1 Tax=Phytophthora megakarya TaxID=4795 RepID=A0A225V037_9STRA|nr:hypothetical protein PHMEG_00030875 [Phytophthora megakarya]